MSSVQVRVHLWDLAGAPDYYEVRNEFYKNAQGGLLVYDVTRPSTFQSLDQWLEEARRHGRDNMASKSSKVFASSLAKKKNGISRSSRPIIDFSFSV